MRRVTDAYVAAGTDAGIPIVTTGQVSHIRNLDTSLLEASARDFEEPLDGGEWNGELSDNGCVDEGNKVCEYHCW